MLKKVLLARRLYLPLLILILAVFLAANIRVPFSFSAFNRYLKSRVAIKTIPVRYSSYTPYSKMDKQSTSTGAAQEQETKVLPPLTAQEEKQYGRVRSPSHPVWIPANGHVE
jgi:hypothetical protein